MLKTHKSEEIIEEINHLTSQRTKQIQANLDWLKKQMHPLFFRFNQKNISELTTLVNSLDYIEQRSRMMLLDTSKQTLLSQIDTVGSLYKTLQDLPDHDISYAELTTSRSTLPNSRYRLEVLRFDYERKQDSEIAELISQSEVPKDVYESVLQELKDHYPSFHTEKAEPLIKMLWCNNPDYIDVSPAKRIARILNLYEKKDNGLLTLATRFHKHL